MRLRVRLVLLFGALVAVATTTSGLLSYAATRDEAITAVDEFLVGRFTRGPESGQDPSTGAELGQLIDRVPGGGPLAADAEADAAADPEAQSDDGPLGEAAPAARPGFGFVGDDSLFAVLDGDELVFASDATVELPVPSAVTDEPTLSTIEVDGIRYRMRAESFEAADTTLTVLTARSLAETDATLAAVRNRLVVIAIAVTLAAVAAAWFVAGRLARPLQRLSAAAETIADTGDISTPLDTDASGEVGQVASSFAGMLEALQRSRSQQQQLVVDAGHELRTPLTTMRGNVELIASGRLTAADQERALALISAELEQLTELTAELVELAGDQPVTAEMSRVDLHDIAHAAAARAGARSGREIRVVGSPTALIGSAAGLDRAISNLLGNAIKFSEPGTPIVVDLTASQLMVTNIGPPIPAEDLDHVFERFYRATVSRALPGSGLGLSIVAAVAAAHGGSPTAENTPDGVRVGFGFDASLA